jgi:hypothetical protein
MIAAMECIEPLIIGAKRDCAKPKMGFYLLGLWTLASPLSSSANIIAHRGRCNRIKSRIQDASSLEAISSNYLSDTIISISLDPAKRCSHSDPIVRTGMNKNSDK